MNILVLGATGRTGNWVLKLALERGYRVHALVRFPEKLQKHRNLKVFEGDASNHQDLCRSAKGCTAAISVLNISRKTDFPWSSLRTPEKYLSKVMANLVKVLPELHLSPLIVCSAWGVGDSKKELPFWFRLLVDNSNIGVAYKDHERQEKILERAPFDWVIVRPSGLTNSLKIQDIKVIENKAEKPNLTIGRKTLASFMLDCLTEKDYWNQRVIVSKA